MKTSNFKVMFLRNIISVLMNLSDHHQKRAAKILGKYQHDKTIFKNLSQQMKGIRPNCEIRKISDVDYENYMDMFTVDNKGKIQTSVKMLRSYRKGRVLFFLPFVVIFIISVLSLSYYLVVKDISTTTVTVSISVAVLNIITWAFNFFIKHLNINPTKFLDFFPSAIFYYIVSNCDNLFIKASPGENDLLYLVLKQKNDLGVKYKHNGEIVVLEHELVTQEEKSRKYLLNKLEQHSDKYFDLKKNKKTKDWVDLAKLVISNSEISDKKVLSMIIKEGLLKSYGTPSMFYWMSHSCSIIFRQQKYANTPSKESTLSQVKDSYRACIRETLLSLDKNMINTKINMLYQVVKLESLEVLKIFEEAITDNQSSDEGVLFFGDLLMTSANQKSRIYLIEIFKAITEYAKSKESWLKKEWDALVISMQKKTPVEVYEKIINEARL